MYGSLVGPKKSGRNDEVTVLTGWLLGGVSSVVCSKTAKRQIQRTSGSEADAEFALENIII